MNFELLIEVPPTNLQWLDLFFISDKIFKPDISTSQKLKR